jgi:uncharacterized protein (DUF2132 family)
MDNKQPNNPLHGLTLETILNQLVKHYGWSELAGKININCFKSDPSIKSSLKFLRKTLWATEKVESLYLSTFTKPDPWGRSAKGLLKEGATTSGTQNKSD